MSRAVAAWRRFWFEPEPASTPALVRVVFGCVLVAWSVTLLPDVAAFFGPDALFTEPDHGRLGWSLLTETSPTWVAAALGGLALAAGVALVVGWHTRVAAAVAFVALVSFERRNPYVFNSGDLLLRHVAFFVLLMPAGAAFSLDQRRRTGSVTTVAVRAPWAVRLLQLQLTIGYAASVWAKARGDTWHDGTALWYALRIDDLLRFGTPPGTGSLVVVNLMTYGVLALEAALAIGLWLPKWRAPLLVAGVVMHLLIDATLLVGFFSYAIFAAYAAFVAPPLATKWLAALAGAKVRRAVEPVGVSTA